MFESTKPFYMTRTVADELSYEHKQVIIKYLFEHYEQLTDYLQIFEFFIEGKQQWLLQRQEEPNREITIPILLEEAAPIDRKVWAMDQGNECIILFPEDY